MRIAIIGGGISGIGAAQVLDKDHEVTLFEERNVIGGHANTVEIPDQIHGTTTNIDTGFIVFNDRNYPAFSAFLRDLNVSSDKTSMSFSYSDNNLNLEYAGTPKGLLPTWGSIMNPKYIALIWSIYKYSRKLESWAQVPDEMSYSIVELLKEMGCPRRTIETYFLPIASAIWSCDTKNVNKIPAHTFIQFFSNHGLLNLRNRPQWYSVCNGSRSYLKAFQGNFKGEIITDTSIVSCREESGKIVLDSATGRIYDFDLAILATPADKSLSIYQGNDSNMKRILSSYHYTSNEVVLHIDQNFMPGNRRIWSSWNFISESNREQGKQTYVTYYMNLLQNLEGDISYFVTLNPPRSPEPETIFYRTTYRHPMLTHDEQSTSLNFKDLNNGKTIYFCGSYLGYGFHEDGFSSGVKVAELVNSRIPSSS